MKVLVAMSGGVDSSVTAALLLDQGHDVVGATMKLWGGASDSGCCSVSDVEDARRVAQQLGITHHVFNFGDEFMANVVDPYVNAHSRGQTPNPCVECNRHIKFDKFIKRALQLRFDAIATGHHAQVIKETGVDGDDYWQLRRGADSAKDQSYVLHMLSQPELKRLLLPVGDFTKDVVRKIAGERGLRTATKPDSQDVCFITSTGGRSAFLGDRIPLRPGRLVDTSGASIGEVPSVEMVTVGQRKGMGTGGDGERRYAVDVDATAGVVTVGTEDDLMTRSVEISDVTFAHKPVVDGAPVTIQVSAHGAPFAGVFLGNRVEFDEPQRRVAPGQSVVFYDGDDIVLGGGTAR